MLRASFSKHYGTSKGWAVSAACRIHRRNLLTLAIETSCDDTAVAVLEKHASTEGSEPVSTALTQSKKHAILHFNERITLPNSGLGGIAPLEALHSHQVNLAKVVSKALQSLPDATPNATSSSPETCKELHLHGGQVKVKPDFISVTRGPGMRSNLFCGLDTAKGLASAWQIPLLGVHHMQAHALTPRLSYALSTDHENFVAEGGGSLQPAFPFLTLLLSGGHTLLLSTESLTSHDELGTTVDTSVGDCLDKIGRIPGLLPDTILAQMTSDTAYAKYLSQYAFPTADSFFHGRVARSRRDEHDKPLNKYKWKLPTPLSDTRDVKFSFVGLQSAAERLAAERIGTSEEEQRDRSNEAERLLIARTAITTAFEHIASRVVIVLEDMQVQLGLKKAKRRASTTYNITCMPKALVVSGGVASNDFLRYYLRRFLDVRGFREVELVFPPVKFCTDNAAMIAWTGMEMFEAGYRHDDTSKMGFEVVAVKKWGMSEAEILEGLTKV